MLFKLEKFIFLALIFSIPFQKRTFLFGPSPEGEGFFEWTSGFLYFTDILIIVLAVLWSIAQIRRFNPTGSDPVGLASFWRATAIRISIFPVGILLVFFAFAFISLTQAELVDVGLYRFIKLGEFIFLFFYVMARSRDIGPPRRARARLGINRILQVFVASGVFQSIIAILQFVKQSSLGLHIFHESTLEIGMKGVAEITVAPSFAEGFGGQGVLQMIRAYGTFPNPNVLAGFLGICLFFIFYLYIVQWGKQKKPNVQNTENHIIERPSVNVINLNLIRRAFFNVRLYVKEIVTGIVIFILSFGLLLTFSRGVIIFFLFTGALFFGGMFLFRKLQQYRKLAIHLLLLVIVFWLLIIVIMWPELSSRFLESSVSEPAISERLFFNKVGVDTVSKNYMPMFFGIGIGNFVSHYMDFLPDLEPHLYQPVHNIFILIASEIGVFSLIAFVLFLAFLIGRAIKSFLASSIAGGKNFLTYSLLFIIFYLLLVSMYDHYFWTLQQGSLMFWILLGLLVSLFPFGRSLRQETCHRQTEEDKL